MGLVVFVVVLVLASGSAGGVVFVLVPDLVPVLEPVLLVESPVLVESSDLSPVESPVLLVESPVLPLVPVLVLLFDLVELEVLSLSPVDPALVDFSVVGGRITMLVGCHSGATAPGSMSRSIKPAASFVFTCQ